jgi:predicted house-cleaning NTP pyrophosphatase (Maf/HAM1 superfamily)
MRSLNGIQMHGCWGQDTLVFLGNQIFGKPKDLSQAHDMLTALQGKVHHVITGVCLLNLAQRKRKVFSDTTSVRFPVFDGRRHRLLPCAHPTIGQSRCLRHPGPW